MFFRKSFNKPPLNPFKSTKHHTDHHHRNHLYDLCDPCHPSSPTKKQRQQGLFYSLNIFSILYLFILSIIFYKYDAYLHSTDFVMNNYYDVLNDSAAVAETKSKSSYGLVMDSTSSHDSTGSTSSNSGLFSKGKPPMVVYSTLPSSEVDTNQYTFMHNEDALMHKIQSPTWGVTFMNSSSQRSYLYHHSSKCISKNNDSKNSSIQASSIIETFDKFASSPSTSHLSVEVFKYCLFASQLQSGDVTGVAYLDIDSNLYLNFEQAFHPNVNTATLTDDKSINDYKGIHGSFLILQKNAVDVAYNMVEFIVKHRERMESLMISSKLLEFVKKSQESGVNWELWQQTCHLGRTISDTAIMPDKCGSTFQHCCTIVSPITGQKMYSTPHIALPHHITPTLDALLKPYSYYSSSLSDVPEALRKDLPYITTIREDSSGQKQVSSSTSKSMLDLLTETNCLPNTQCKHCLKHSGTNEKCQSDCGCFVSKICSEKIEPKPVSKVLLYDRPVFRKDPNRLIPRILHQTYFEELSEKLYPNFSRFKESLTQIGWEYRFYNDEAAENLIATHFPPEVNEAFQTLIPGAFKADLLRYCALFIYGGVYADVDVIVSAKLDKAIQPDIGLMIPIDTPGSLSFHRMCLWNGFIAVAPGHPVIADLIEVTVNHIRNRFTSVDVMATLCPNPDYTVSHAFDLLFTTGPCIFGATLNRFLERAPQSTFEGIYDVDLSSVTKVSKDDIPGRIVILSQHKEHMGAHRFTFEQENLIVASTDLENSNDRNTNGNRPHYSQTRYMGAVYGLEGLYVDLKRANSDIRFKHSTE